MITALRFDIVEAWWLWLCLHHCGIVDRPYTEEGGFGPVQRNPEWWCSYNNLSTMETRLRFKPAPNLSYETLTEHSQEIYDQLCQRLGSCDCLDEKAGINSA